MPLKSHGDQNMTGIESDSYLLDQSTNYRQRELFIFRISEGEHKDGGQSLFLIKWGGQFTPLCAERTIKFSLMGLPHMTSVKFSDFLTPPCHCHKSSDFVPIFYFLGTPSGSDVIYGSPLTVRTARPPS